MFINLHNHSTYSLLDSTIKLEDMVDKVKQLNQSALAITEHGNVFSAIKLYKLCRDNNIKFIYGCEFYITDDIQIKDKNNKYYHLIVLSKTEQGRINLNKLLTLAHLEGKYYKPRIDFNLLKRHKEGLIVLSACMAGEVQRNFQWGEPQKAKEIALRYKKEFGNDYYIELQSHSDKEQLKLSRQCVDLAKKLNIEHVVTSDSHYINKDEQELHSIFVAIGQEREVGEAYIDCFIQGEDDVRKIMSNILTQEELDMAINNTMKIANKCNVKMPLSPPQIPHVEVPAKFDSEEAYLKYLCNKGWVSREINNLSQEEQKKYKDRLYYEFDAIRKMGFAGYYLLVYSYTNTVKRRGIARGSGGGSFIAYLLNIVDIDPIKYNLYFERFIDVSAIDLLESGKIKPEELKIPDFDQDFGKKDREKVIEYIINKYGQDKVGNLGTFQYIWGRSAIKDIGKVLEIPFEITNEITKQLDVDDKNISDEILNTKLKKWVDKYPKLFEYAKKIEGLPKSYSQHPCGQTIAIKDINYYTPMIESKGDIALQIDMYDAEDLGLCKIDTLGLRTIDVIYDILNMINKDYEYINPQNLNFNDEKVFEAILKTTTGVFQFESDGMRSVLKKMNVNCLDDLITANALYRPGSIKYIDNYIDRKMGKEKIEYIHEDLKPILDITYGIIVFQEQLIEIGRLAKMRNPDQLRKATGKKLPKLMEEVEPELRKGLETRGWGKKQIDKIWEDMLVFSSYSFNKSHSAAYSITAYITAMLKTYHPAEFVCALFNSYQGKIAEMEKCFKEAQILNVKINKPNITNPIPLCGINNGEIDFGISLIKHCNSQIADEIKELSKKKYNNFLDFLVDIRQETNINTRQMEILSVLNFFNTFAENQKLITFTEIFNLLHNKKQLKKDKITQLSQQYQYINHDTIKSFVRETEKSYMDFDWHSFLSYVWQQIPNKSIPLQEQVIKEKEFLGYAHSIKSDMSEQYHIATAIDAKYSPRATLYNLKNGTEKTYKIQKKLFFNKQRESSFGVGDMVKVKRIEEKSKRKLVDEEWTEDPTIQEEWLTMWSVISPAKGGAEID